MRIACLLFMGLITTGSLQAHNVVWWENPFGLFPSNPMELEFGLDDCGFPDYGEIGIVPFVGEPCTVVVNLDPPTSSAIKTSFAGGVSTANAVWIYVDVNPFMGLRDVNTVVSGEWHATGLPANSDCTATNPNPFSVPITVKVPILWKIFRSTMPGMVQIDTGGVLWGLRASSSLTGP